MKVQSILTLLASLPLLAAHFVSAQEEGRNPIDRAIEARSAADANMNEANTVLNGAYTPVPNGEEEEMQSSAEDDSIVADQIPTSSQIPEGTIPEETIPEETIPEGSIPEESIPEESIPEETIPEDFTPESTVPEGTLERFDLDYNEAPIRTILSNVAAAADLNVIIPDSLLGNLSLQLKNVTWPQVYDIALEGTGFVWSRSDDGIIRIRRVGADQAIQIAEDGSLTVNFRNEPTRSAVQALAQAVGLNIIIPNDMDGSTSASLSNVSWERVLTTILEGNGYQWFEDDGIIGVREIDSRVVLDSQTGLLSLNLDDTPFQEVATLIGQTQTPVVNVVSPPEIEDLLISLNVQGVNFEQALNLAILKLPRIPVDQVGGEGAVQFRSFSTYQVGPTLIQIVDQQFIQNLRNEPPVVRIFDLRYAGAGDLLIKIMPSPSDTSETSNEAIPSFRTRAGGIQPVVDGVQSVAADHANNLLLITARPSAFAEVSSLIERLDQPLKQILIESKFVEITGQDSKDLGVDWSTLEGFGFGTAGFSRSWTRDRSQIETTTESLSTNQLSNSSSNRSFLDTTEILNGVESNEQLIVRGSDGLSDFTNDRGFDNVIENIAATSRLDSAIFTTDQFRLVLRALEQENDAKLITNPNVVAINGKQALVELTDYLYKPGPTEVSDGVTTTGTPEPLEPRPGTTLEVTPTVVGGQLISLKVIPQVNNVIGQQIIDGNQIPTVRRRATDSEVLLRSGSTLAIGGLITDENVTDTNKVPVLGDIPIIGRLFSSEQTSVQTNNQIIFITASLLNPQSNTYMDVVGIDRFNEMGLTDREVQGVGSRQLSPKELQLQQAVRQARNEAATEEILNALRLRDSIEESEVETLEDTDSASGSSSNDRPYSRPANFGPVGRR